ncbi:hypothetical protein RND81_14G084300 [Saponaria officinalis]|uniref:Uncharacterized protein n=1 Tax=Saponaria officinalis TaxID=3572 RepID=A0AAW1GNC0_SAPOF
MTHALTTIPPIYTITRSSITPSNPNKACNSPCLNVHAPSRRNVIALGISGVILGLNMGEKNAMAAARRPPPTPPNEKKDPNVNGVLAKVLASKKRKEAMKEAMAKQRELGKKIED